MLSFRSARPTPGRRELSELTNRPKRGSSDPSFSLKAWLEQGPCLTSIMHLARPTLLAVLAVAVAIYAFDCGVTVKAEQAMQCCNSMPCASNGLCCANIFEFRVDVEY